MNLPQRVLATHCRHGLPTRDLTQSWAEAAREHETHEDEVRWEERLKKIAKASQRNWPPKADMKRLYSLPEPPDCFNGPTAKHHRWRLCRVRESGFRVVQM